MHRQDSGADARLLDTVTRSGRPRMAVAYDITSSSPMELVAALGGMCDIVWIVDTNEPTLGSMVHLLPRLGIVVDTHGLTRDELLASLHDHGVDGVVAFTDSQLALAAQLADSLGLQGNATAVIDRLNDKYLQRSALAEAGILGPRFVRIPRTDDAAAAVARTSELSFPVVVKPCHGDSSRDVISIDGPAELGALLELAAAEPTRREDFIAEEYLANRTRGGHQAFASYVSVEMIVQSGRPVPLAITGRFPLAEPFRESGSFMPHALDEDEAAQVLDLAVEAAVAVGVCSGALHTEIKLTPSGPRVIEVNGRVGGGGIDSLYARAHGTSLSQLAVRVAMGEHVDLVPETPTRWDGPFFYEFFVQPPTWAHQVGSLVETDQLVGIAGVERVALNRSLDDCLDWRRGSQGYILQAGGRATDREMLASVPDLVTAAARINYR